MKYLFFIIIIILTHSCAKHKSVLICGDHVCVNNSEAKKYFEENLSLEVQIISKDKQSSYDLIDLNVEGSEPKIQVYERKNKKIVKKLSKDEIKAKKKELKKRKKKTKKVKDKQVLVKKKSSEIISSSNSKNNAIDICKMVKKCDIDSIANYLIEKSNKRDYPNISLRE